MRNLPTFFGADPIGRGGGNVESLTGFFARLCIARYVQATHVVREFVVDRCPSGMFPRRPLALGNFLSQRCAKLDLRPDCALAFAGALERLTSQRGLQGLTVSGFGGVLDPNSVQSLGRNHKYWCAACFAAWQADGSPLYEPLLWRFALVERCPVHRVGLLNRCPTCRRRQPLITQAVPIGHCVRCGHLLHRGTPVASVEEASLDVSDRWALWRSVALSRVLAWTNVLKAGVTVPRSVVVDGMSRLLARALERPPAAWIRAVSSAAAAGVKGRVPPVGSRLRAASFLGIGVARFYRLVSGECCPTLGVLVDSCMQLGVDPVGLLRGDVEGGERSWPPEVGSSLMQCGDPWALAIAVRERRMATRYPERARVFEEFIRDPEAVDLTRLERYGGNRSSLRLAFPMAYARAAELRVERLVRKRELDAAHWKAVLEREIGAGAPRPIAAVAASLGIPHASLTYYCPEHSARIVAMRELSMSTRQPGLRDRVEAALVAARRVQEGPTVHEVARSLGVKDFVVASLCPEDYRLLVDQRERERTARRERYAAAMREDLRRCPPRGVTWVADSLGVCCGTLRASGSEALREVVGCTGGAGSVFEAAARGRCSRSCRRGPGAAVSASSGCGSGTAERVSPQCPGRCVGMWCSAFGTALSLAGAVSSLGGVA